MDRSDVIELPKDTDWLDDSGARAVCRAIEAGGGQVFFVGGCVRDALLGKSGADVDLSTDVLPEEVMQLAQDAGLRAVPTGIDHGTITVVARGTGYEVTTFRKDIRTDGRRAVVAFSTDINADARRRDFTLNALYATPEGRVLDPLECGVKDCLNRRIRFIDDAVTRIREDYLRILRYFRFHAWYAAPDAGFDPEALDAIARNSPGLETLSAERVGAEVLRLLAAPDPGPAVAAMRATGCLAIVLPGADDTFLSPVIALENALSVAPDARLRLAALGGVDVADALRLSRADARQLSAIREAGFNSTPLPEVAYRSGAELAQYAAILRAALASSPIDSAAMDKLKAASDASFPVTARDLMPELSGKALGDRLSELERRWIASGFTLTREDLMTAQ